jgi:lipopolysaccharide export system permease protein
MRLLKRIDYYTLAQFVKLFLATFFVSLFVFLMQFLWKYVDDMVGKGLGLKVLAEFFFYAAVSLVPLALPMSIMLASLMSFGNMGEQLELLAMKSAGISLFRIMRALMIVIAFAVVGAFFFSNDVLPESQTKMWTLLISMRQKSPELEIPAGEFYKDISGYSIYVSQKNDKTQLLKHVIVYDFTSGFSNAAVMSADSARLDVSPDKKFLLFTLYNGESFENLQQQNTYANASKIPYRRETFRFKQMIIDFDSNFNQFSTSLLKNENVSKNVKELKATIDSLNKQLVVMKKGMSGMFLPQRFYGNLTHLPQPSGNNPIFKNSSYATDSLFVHLTESQKKMAVTAAISSITQTKGEIGFSNIQIKEIDEVISRHAIDLHRKFALSFACLIFFFIGAPLGAIIRKGGFGTPVVLSILMFIVYYIVDNTGTKMAREGIWPVWEGMWLSSAILLPIGLFLTYKAVTDSTIMNSEAYMQIFKRSRLAIYHWIKKHVGGLRSDRQK